MNADDEYERLRYADTSRVVREPLRASLLQIAVEYLRAIGCTKIRARLDYMPTLGVAELDRSPQRFDFCALSPNGSTILGDCPTAAHLSDRNYDDHRIEQLMRIANNTESIEPWFFVEAEDISGVSPVDVLKNYLDIYRHSRNGRLVRPYVRIVQVGAA
jgi:hypothetical protein